MSFISKQQRVFLNNVPDDYVQLVGSQNKMREFDENADLRSWSCNTFKRHQHLLELMTENVPNSNDPEIIENPSPTKQDLSIGDIGDVGRNADVPSQILERICNLLTETGDVSQKTFKTTIEVDENAGESCVKVKCCNHQSYDQWCNAENQVKYLMSSASEQRHFIRELKRQLTHVKDENKNLRQYISEHTTPLYRKCCNCGNYKV